MTDSENDNQQAGIGPSLRAFREKQGVNLQEAASTLRIRESFLRSIEAGRYDTLPGSPYAAGFIRAYAEYLDLDGDEAVRRYRAEAQAPAATVALQFPTPIYKSSTPRTGIILVGLLLSVVAYGGWYASTTKDGFVAELVAPVPERLAALTPNHDETAVVEMAYEGRAGSDLWGDPWEPPAVETQLADASATQPGGQRPVGTPGAEPDAAANGQATIAMNDAPPLDLPADPSTTGLDRGGLLDTFNRPAETGVAQAPRVGADAFAAEPRTAFSTSALTGDAAQSVASARIILQANDTTWVQVKDSRGKRLMSKLMEPGDVYSVPNEADLRMTVGNAGGLDVHVDGDRLPPLGKSGEVLHIVLDVERLQRGDAARR
ncbi:MAG: helix-turn-helix domain-containing protein [Rhodospirillales bacterium]|nr:helix-turn-helix domain-containing protein [Rhodospirillales bacterium]